MYSKQDIEKLGNTVIYLAERIDDLSKTKLLKILYLLDEVSISQSGLPFLNLKYKVWQLGPVAQDVYVDLSGEQPKMLDEYISLVFQSGNRTYISAKKGFNDDEFNDNEIELLEKITQALKNQPAFVLIDYTHKKDSLWHNTANRHNLIESFNKGWQNTSNIELDFSEIIQDQPLKLSIYQHHLELESSLGKFKVC